MNIAIVHNSIICEKKLFDGPFMVYCVLAMEAGINKEDAYACTVLDIDIIKNSSLSDNAFRLYSFLAMYAGSNFNWVSINLNELPKLTNKTRKTVQRAFRELTSKGIIEIIAPDTYIVHDYYRDTLEG